MAEQLDNLGASGNEDTEELPLTPNKTAARRDGSSASSTDTDTATPCGAPSSSTDDTNFTLSAGLSRTPTFVPGAGTNSHGDTSSYPLNGVDVVEALTKRFQEALENLDATGDEGTIQELPSLTRNNKTAAAAVTEDGSERSATDTDTTRTPSASTDSSTNSAAFLEVKEVEGYSAAGLLNRSTRTDSHDTTPPSANKKRSTRVYGAFNVVFSKLNYSSPGQSTIRYCTDYLFTGWTKDHTTNVQCLAVHICGLVEEEEVRRFQVEEFQVGKTFIKAKKDESLSLERPVTWDLKGITSRYTTTSSNKEKKQGYKESGYQKMVIVAIITKKMLEDNEFPGSTQEYALALESGVWSHLTYTARKELLKSSANTGALSSEDDKYEAHLVYVALKLKRAKENITTCMQQEQAQDTIPAVAQQQPTSRGRKSNLLQEHSRLLEDLVDLKPSIEPKAALEAFQTEFGKETDVSEQQVKTKVSNLKSARARKKLAPRVI